MKGILVIAVALASLSAPAVAQQTELGGKLRSGREVTIPAGETVQGDLVATAGTVRINGRVEGDLVASGGQVIIDGTITGDVLVAAGSATISGQVDGDLRVAAGQVRLRGRVGEDALLGAGQATLASDARIGGDLIFGAGRVQLDGAVTGNVQGSTGSYSAAGTIGGGEQVNLGRPRQEQEPTFADRASDALRRYVSILLIGVLLLWLLPKVFLGAAGAARRQPLISFATGVLGVIGVIVALALTILITVLISVVLGLLGLGTLAGVTVVAGILVVAIMLFLSVLAMTFVAQATAALTLGRLLLRGAHPSFLAELGALALGLLAVVLLAAIPVAGGWLEALLVLLGLGALLLTARPRQRITQLSGRALMR